MKHHFVPQFLLGRWVNPANRGRLVVFSVRNGRLVAALRKPEYTGYEDDLYALTHDQIGAFSKHDLEEKLFKPLDNDAAVARAKLEANEGLTERDRTAWTRFLASLRMRSPDVLSFLRGEAVEHLRKTLAERDAKTLPEGVEGTESHFERYLPGLIQNAPLGHLANMIDHPDVISAFGGLTWATYELPALAPRFLLCDYPGHVEGGLHGPELTVILPIAPTVAFIGTRSTKTSDYIQRISGAEFAVRTNRATVANAVERIWAWDERDARPFIERNLGMMGTNTISFRSLAPWNRETPAQMKRQGVTI